jgi:tRNA(fMet)-specific endonuclease VapC
MAMFMLDTNIVSYFVRGNPRTEQAILSCPMSDICISAITEAELLYGMAKRPQSSKIENAIHEFLMRVQSLPWGRDEAASFAASRSSLERAGFSLDSFDMLIAAHALSVDAILVTSDKAFSHVPDLKIENWA